MENPKQYYISINCKKDFNIEKAVILEMEDLC